MVVKKGKSKARTSNLPQGFKGNEDITSWYATELPRVLRLAALPGIDIDQSTDRLIVTLAAILTGPAKPPRTAGPDSKPMYSPNAQFLVLEMLLDAGIVKFFKDTIIKYHRSPRRSEKQSAYDQFGSLWMATFIVLGDLAQCTIIQLSKRKNVPECCDKAALEFCDPAFGLALTQSVKHMSWTVASYKAICSILTIMVSEPQGVTYDLERNGQVESMAGIAGDLWNRVQLPPSAASLLYIPAEVLSSCIGIYRRHRMSYNIENFTGISYPQVVARACEEMRSSASCWRHDAAQINVLYSYVLHFVYNGIVPTRGFVGALVEDRYLELAVRILRKMRTVRGMEARRKKETKPDRWDKDLFDRVVFLFQLMTELGYRYDSLCDLREQIVESGIMGLVGEWSRDARDRDLDWATRTMPYMVFQHCDMKSYRTLFLETQKQLEDFVSAKVYPGPPVGKSSSSSSTSTDVVKLPKFSKARVRLWRLAVESVRRGQPGQHPVDLWGLDESPFKEEEGAPWRFEEVGSWSNGDAMRAPSPKLDVEVDATSETLVGETEDDRGGEAHDEKDVDEDEDEDKDEEEEEKDEPTQPVNLVCARCFESEGPYGEELMRCSKCMAEVYCSRTCQIKQWKHHKKQCVRPEAATEAEVEP